MPRNYSCPEFFSLDILSFVSLWWKRTCIHGVLPAAAAAKSLQSCPTLCDPIDGSPLGSAVPGILQARTLGWVAISFSNAWKWKVKGKSLSRVRLLATPWTAAYRAPGSAIHGILQATVLEWLATAFSGVLATHQQLCTSSKMAHKR